MSNSPLQPLDNIIQIEIENIVGKEATVGGEIVEKLDKFDQQVRNYYLSLESPRLRVFNEFMSLFCLLIISIGFESLYLFQNLNETPPSNKYSMPPRVALTEI